MREEPLDAFNQEDVSWYTTTYLPKLIAYNLALMHDAGLVHSFPSTGNTTQLGGLVDLDGVRGAPLGLDDEELKVEDYVRDIAYYTERTELGNNLFAVLYALLVPEGRSTDPDDLHKEIIGDDFFDVILNASFDFDNNLVVSYLEQRFGPCNPDTPNTRADEMIDFVRHLRKNGDHLYLVDSYLRTAYLSSALHEEDSITELDEENAVAELVKAVHADFKESLTLTIIQCLFDEIAGMTVEELNDPGTKSYLDKTIRNAFLSQAMRMLSDGVAQIVASEVYQERIAQWLDENTREDNPLTRDQVLQIMNMVHEDRLALKADDYYDLQEILNEIQRMTKDHDYTTKSVFAEPDDTDEQDIYKTFFNKHVTIYRDPLTKQQFMSRLAPGSDSDIRIDIKGMNVKKGLTIPASDTVHIHEVFQNKRCYAPQLHIKGQGDELNFAKGSFHLPGEELGDFVAWHDENMRTGQRTLHIRVANTSDKAYFKEALRGRGYSINILDEALKQVGGDLGFDTVDALVKAVDTEA